MSDTLRGALSVRDYKMIVFMYLERDIAKVADHFNISHSAVTKRFQRIHEALGPLFEFSRKGVAVERRAHHIVEEIKHAIRRFEALNNLVRSPENRNRRRVNISVTDLFEPILLVKLLNEIEPTRIKDLQIIMHHTASNILNDRVQNLDESTRLLEMGEIDILVCYEYSDLNVKSSLSRVPQFNGMKSRLLYSEELMCVVNGDLMVSNPMTDDEYNAFMHITQEPALTRGKADTNVVATSGCSIFTLVESDPRYISLMPKSIAEFYRDHGNLQVVRPPHSYRSTMELKIVWSHKTQFDNACTEVRSAIIRSIAEEFSSENKGISFS